VPASLVARWNEIQLAVLHAVHSRNLDAGFRRIAFIVGGVDRKDLRLDLLEPGRRLVIGR
jgi:hypothetical protein